MFAALVHDVGHKGVNNSFLVQTLDILAILYNDNSVLENMHAAKTFELLQEYKLLDDMKPDEFKIFRKVVIRLILDTDLQRHFKII